MFAGLARKARHRDEVNKKALLGKRWQRNRGGGCRGRAEIGIISSAKSCR